MAIYLLVIFATFLHAWGSRQQGNGETLIGIFTFGIASLVTGSFIGLGNSSIDIPIMPLITLFDVNALLIFSLWAAIAYWVGESTGWGDMFGALVDDREMVDHGRESWWHKIHPALKTNKYISSIARGIIWAAPLCLVALIFGSIPLAIAYLITFSTCFIVSIIPARKLYNKPHSHAGVWALSEYIRGAWVALAPILIFSFIV